MPQPYFDPTKTPLELVLTAGEGNSEKSLTMKLNLTGTLKEDNGKGYETSEGLILNIRELSKMINDVRRAAGLKKADQATYQMVLVKVRDISTVAAAETAIKQMGFSTMSMESIRKPMEKEAQQKQMMLGGLGAISLIVAALGITNTMIMSISERTREIGIMKALGCKIDDIRTLFLLEAGSIGLIGGFAAIATSLLISSILNVVQSKQTLESVEQLMQILTTPGSRMSVIPLWLIGFSLVFSVFIGLFSGFHPANKAVRIPALEAIKSE